MLVGRTKELERASTMLDAAAAGRGGLLLLTGEPGIGKSRLSQHIEQAATSRGFRVAWGRCWEVGGAPAFWPWTQIFEALALADPFVARPDAESDHRFRQFDRAARMLVEVSAAQPLAIILDDLHAADQSSLDMALRLARGVRATHILFVIAYRDAEARLGATGTVISKIAREGEVCTLGRLAPEDINRWIRSVSPDAPDAIGASVYRATEGNPLFVHELLRVGDPHALDPRRLPDGLSTVLDEHLGLVSPDVRALLAIASVLGREASVADVAALADTPLDTVDDAFRRATAAALIEPVGRAERYAISHVLLRDRLYAALSPSRRAALHWAAGEHGASRGDVANAAFHLLEGARAGDPRRAAEVARHAASDAMARFAFEAAATLSTRALAVLPDGLDELLRCELEILRAEALVRAGEPTAQADCVRAARLARTVGSPDLEARAALAYGAEIQSSVVDPTMVALLRDALASLERHGGDDRLRARVLARMAAALTPPLREHYEEIHTRAREAITLARSLGDADTQVYVTRFAMLSLGYHVPRDEFYEIVKEVTALATKHDRPIVLLDAAGWSMCTLREQGRKADAARVVDAYEAIGLEVPRAHHRWRLPLLRATLAILDGELDAAAWLGRECLAIADEGNIELAHIGWAQHRVALAIARGDAASIAPDAERIIARGLPASLWAYEAWLLAAIGRTDEARARIAASPLDHTQYPMALVAAEAVVLLRDVELARRTYDALLAMPDRLVMFWGGPTGTSAIGPWARSVANLAALLGRHDDARRFYDEAIATAQRLEAKPFEALARAARAAIDDAPARTPVPAAGCALVELARHGDHWTLAFEGRSHVLKARRGLLHLASIVGTPGRAIHVLELASSDGSEPHKGHERGAPLLDAKAKADYRARLERLREAAEQADAMGAHDRAEQARAEIDAIATELARALGLGGRDRTAATAADRARSAVTLAIRRAIDAVKQVEPVLGGHLEAGIQTGMFCSYRPDPRAALAWRVRVTT